VTEPLLSALVVGGDGLIGASLLRRLRSMGLKAYGTTRRHADVGTDSVRLDLDSGSEISQWHSPITGGVAFLCAGITSIAACEADPEATSRVNVLHTLTLAQKLIESGIRLVLLSSNAVFDGASPEQDELSDCRPATEYGRQKCATEQGLLKIAGKKNPVAIVRLSKVFTSSAGMAAEFMRHFSAGEICAAFDDLKVSPVSMPYVLDGLIAVARSGQSGVFHLSGSKEMTYAEFAGGLAAAMGADASLVRPMASATTDAKVLFRPEHPSLGMKRMRQLLGIAPEAPADMFQRIIRS